MTPKRDAGTPQDSPDEAADLLALENQVCFALAVASRSVLALYRPLLEPHGITHPQYLVLLALWERSPRTVTDIGTAIQLDKATLSPLLKRLEAAGYITRTRNSGDERSLDVALSDAGLALRAEAEKIPAAIMGTLGMTAAQLERLRGELHTVIAAANSAETRRRPGDTASQTR